MECRLLSFFKSSSTALALSLLLTACNTETPEEHISNARSYLSEGNINAAILELKNAIQQAPENIESRHLLAATYLQLGNFAAAEKEFSRALRNGGDPNILTPYLAQSLFGQSDVRALEKLLSHSHMDDPSARANVLGIHAVVLLQHGKTEEAEEALQQAQSLDKDAFYVILAHSSLLAEQQQVEQARKQLHTLQESFKNNSHLLLILGHIELASGHYTDAIEAYSQAVTLSPMAIHYNLFLAQALVRDKQYNRAEPYTDRLLSIHPTHALANELKAIILYDREEYSDAKSHADVAIKNGSQNHGAMIISGVTAYKQGNYDEANRHFARVAPFVDTDHFIKRLFASTQFQLGNMDGALSTLQAFDLSLKENNDFTSQMSLEFARIGRNNDAMALATKAHTHDIDNAALRLGLIQLANNNENGIQLLNDVLSKQPASTDANLGLIYYYLNNDKNAQATKAIDQWLAASPDDPIATMLKGHMALQQKRYDNAESYFKKAAKLDPNNLTAQLSLSQLHFVKGEKETAFQDTFALAVQHMDNYVVAKYLFKYALTEAQRQQALTLYKEHVADHPDNLDTRMILARSYGTLDNYGEAISLLKDLPPNQQSADSWSFLTLLYFKQNAYRKALHAANQWLERDPLNPEAYIRTIQISELTGNYSSGVNVANQALTLFSDQPEFTLMKAGLLIKDKQYDTGQALLNAQPADIQQNVYFLRLQGEMYNAQKEYSKAIPLYKKRYETQPSLSAAKDLAVAYAQNNQTEKAAAFLESVIKEYGEAAEPLTILLAQMQLKDKPEQAITHYQSVLAKEPNNVIALNNLAWLYMRKNDITQACQSAKKAYQLASEAPEIQDTYGYCLLKAGNTRKSMATLKTAYENLSSSVEIGLHYAESLIMNHQFEQAKVILDQLSPTDAKHQQQKQKLLDSLTP
ncbi:XrtA/PEP-CTERM system TPR-repeat protein PrsT [Photobacterium aphoticum]|uniref:XrtA/PEP-CTERM system TPR-repeat protein PrsT n=1 Tax=Photobacterium aphoticum TaxID=754436 RepID=UPI0009E48EA7|nr:XrtA/PEP-CTERM system TPR-repeat protein PrsT [Photobacterium aphoticum]PSU58431.1 PEP-CTERM system TPR-repeat protein PrsT [Photobacterium aphoticum]GHA37185.1 lipoprotein [Photobacterium aphoticum]